MKDAVWKLNASIGRSLKLAGCVWEKGAKQFDTKASTVVPDQSTSLAQPCLTSACRWERVCSRCYDRTMIRWCLARYMYTIWHRTVHISSNGAHRHTQSGIKTSLSPKGQNDFESLSPLLIFCLWTIKQHPTKRTCAHPTADSIQYAQLNLETLREQLEVPVFVAGESFLFSGRSSNTNALTVQQSPPFGGANASDHWAPPCGYTHRWGRRNGPRTSPWGPFVFLVPYY